jgi:HPt (histidine-containing phosphotransfer) domain-containing protein
LADETGQKNSAETANSVKCGNANANTTRGACYFVLEQVKSSKVTATFSGRGTINESSRRHGRSRLEIMLVSEMTTEVFDLTAALEGVEGRHDRLQRIIDIYFDEAPLRVAQISSGLAEQEATSVAQAAHRLAGTLVYLRAARALAAAQCVDDRAVAGDLYGANAAFATLEENLALLDQVLASERPRMLQQK